MSMRPLTVVRKALLKEFGGLWPNRRAAVQAIRDCTYKGSDDPGGWSPSAPVVIHCESGLPSPLYDAMVLWDRVDNDLSEAGLYHEPVNGAVVVVYPA